MSSAAGEEAVDRSAWQLWGRPILAVLLGYVLYAGGLMALVFTWFMSDRPPLTPVQHGVNVVALLLLGVAVAMASRWVAGSRARPALLAVLAIVLALGVLNVALGVAVEPPWFTVTAMVTVGTVLLIAWSRSTAR